MAIEDINIRLKMAATGVDQQVENSEQIANNYAKANANAQRLNATVNAQAGAQKARAAAMDNSRTTAEMMDYDKAGGITGRGGAQARDFANQAQGLGGLVRLYAITAANVYALTEAFGALSRAMDTTNMVKGLDTLGAASGRALGTLSKQLAQVSDGAISMREAMQATAMSSSAGMTNQQILRMGEIAKNASLALGVNMPDAINRLSRGIVKLEPELLDELGIFTKIEPAVQAYALQLGKSVSSLTDFERRQAFANAVLKEGEDKFSAINGEIDSNSFDKLAASLKNVAQTGLELLNTVLAPIAELLSKSPSALAGGLVLLAATLVKRAVPALTQIRENLDAERKAAQALVAKKKEDTVAAGAALGQLAFNKVKADMEANAESELRIFERKEAKLNELKQQGLTYSKQLNELMKKDIYDISQSEVDAAKQAARDRLKAAKDAHKELMFLQKQGFTVSAEDMGKAKSERLAAQSEYGAVTALDRTVKAEQNFVNAQKTLIDQYKEKLQLTDQFKSLVAAEEKMVISAKRSEILANMAYNTSLIGIRDSYKLMVAEAEAAGNIGNLATLKLKAIAVGIGSIITSALGAIGTIIQVITGLIAGFGLLDAALSKNSKETQQFNDAIGNSESSINAARKAMELYEKKNEDSIKSTVAMANAFGELTDSMEVSIKKFDKMVQNANWWDDLTDKVKGLFGFGREDALAESLRKQLDSALDVAEKFGQRGELDEQLKSYLNVENMLDKNAVEKALKGLDSSAKAGLQEILGTFKSRFQEIAGTLDGFRENLDKTYKSFQQFMQSMALTDPLAKLSASFGQLAISMTDVAVMSAQEVIKAFEELAKSPEKLAMFSPKFIEDFFKIKDAFTIEKEQVDAYESAIDKMSKKLNEFKQVQADAQSAPWLDSKKAMTGMAVGAGLGAAAGTATGPLAPIGIPAAAATGAIIGGVIGTGVGIFEKVSKNITAYFTKSSAETTENTIDAYKQIQGDLQTTFKEVTELFARGATEALNKATKLNNMALENSAIRAGNTIASAYATILTGPQAVAEQARIAKSEQSINIRNAKIAVDMIDQQDSLTNAIRENTAAVQLNTESRLPDSPGKTERIAKIEKGRDIANLTERLKDLKPDEREKALEGVDPAIARAATARAQIRDQAKDQARAKLREEQAKASAIDIKAGIETKAADLAQTKQLQDLENNIKQLGLQRLDIQTQILGVTTEQTINAKFAEQATIREKNNQAEIADIKFKQEETEKGLAAAEKAKDKDRIASYKNQEAFLKQLKAGVEARQKAEGNLEELRKRQELLNKELDTIRKQFELRKSNQDVIFARSEAALEIERASTTARAEVLGYDKQHTTEILYQLDLERNRRADERSRFDITQRYNQQFEEAGKRQAAAGQTAEDLQKEIAKEQERILKLRDNELAKLDTQLSKQNELLRIGKEQTLELERQRLLQDTRTKQQALSQAEFEATSSTTQFSPTYTAQRTFRNTIQQQITFNPEVLKLQDSALKQIREYETITSRIQALQLMGEEATQEDLDKQTLALEAAKRTQALLATEIQQRTAIAQKTLEAAEYQAKIAEETERSNRAADAFKGTMGGTGDKLAEFITGLNKFMTTRDANERSFSKVGEDIKSAAMEVSAIASDIDALSMGPDNDEAIKALQDKQKLSIKTYERGLKEQNKLTKKSMLDELELGEKQAANTKNLFKEKTAAYKAFYVVEKTLHGLRMAMAAIQMAVDIKAAITSMTTASTQVAADSTKAASGGVVAVINAIKDLPFPLNLAAGAATAAFVASVIGKAIGGSGSKPAFVPSAEQRQETQGTAMAYDSSGNKVQVRRGVFGDENAKSESIANSLAIIRDNSVDGLAYDNKMLRALESLSSAISKASTSLFNVRGLRGGSLSGIVEGTNTSGGFLGIGGLFSKSVSKSIIDSGLELTGTFYDLSKGVSGTINTFETVSNTVKKSGFFGIGGSTKTYTSTITQDLADVDSKAFTELVKTFEFAADTLYSVGEIAGVSSDAVTAGLKATEGPGLISLRGLKGEAFTKELGAVVGALLDDAALAIFPMFEDFAKFGEGMLETVIRVVDTNKKAIQATKNMGIDFEAQLKEVQIPYISISKMFGLDGNGFFGIGGSTDIVSLRTPSSEELKTLSYQFTENMVELAGGLENFLSQSDYFIENFLTDAEKLAPKQKAVREELARLGFASVTTTEQFKEAVLGLNLATQQGRSDRQALMTIQEDFIDLYKETEELLSDLSKQTAELNSELSSSDLVLKNVILKTSEYVEKLRANGTATAANIKIITEWSKATALKELRNNFKTAYEERKRELESSIDGLKKFKNALVDLKNSLDIGESSTLTPLEQYNKLLSQYEMTLTNVRSTDTAVADAAKQAFPQLAQQLLRSGRELYASSNVFTELSQRVNTDISDIQKYIDNQISDQEALLKALEDDFKPILKDIADNTLTASDKLNDAYTLWKQYSTLNPEDLANKIASNLIKTDNATLSTIGALTNTGIAGVSAAGQQALVESGKNTVYGEILNQLTSPTPAVFTRLDTTRDYSISQGELKAAFVETGLLTEADTRKLITSLDTNLNSTIDRNEVKFRALGGPVSRNEPYIVGETGPELFVPNNSGTIVPNNDLSFNNEEIVAKLDQLIQAVSNGAVLNVQATRENAESIEQAINNNTTIVRTQNRIGIR